MKKTIIVRSYNSLSIGYSIGISYIIERDHLIKLRHMTYDKKNKTFGFNYNIPKKYRKYDGKHLTPTLAKILKSNNILSYDIWEKNVSKYNELCEDLICLEQSILSGKLN